MKIDTKLPNRTNLIKSSITLLLKIYKVLRENFFYSDIILGKIFGRKLVKKLETIEILQGSVKKLFYVILSILIENFSKL